MSVRSLIAALTVLSLAFGGTALASPNDAPTPLKRVQVDKTGKKTKTDDTVKRDRKRMPARKLKTDDAPRKGKTPLKVKTRKPVRRPDATPRRSKTQDIKPAPRVDRGTKPTTGPAPTKRDDGSDYEANGDKRATDTKVKRDTRPTTKRDPKIPVAPGKRAPK